MQELLICIISAALTSVASLATMVFSNKHNAKMNRQMHEANEKQLREQWGREKKYAFCIEFSQILESIEIVILAEECFDGTLKIDPEVYEKKLTEIHEFINKNRGKISILLPNIYKEIMIFQADLFSLIQNKEKQIIDHSIRDSDVFRIVMEAKELTNKLRKELF